MADSKLKDDELDKVSGGTTYGDGYDGTERPIVLISNSCALFEFDSRYAMDSYVGCETCKYYSYNQNRKDRITLLSGWCVNPQRTKGHDIIHGEK